MKILALLVLLGLLATSFAHSTIRRPLSPSEAYDRATFVGLVRVEKTEIARSDTLNCGIQYVTSVLETYKGEESSQVFISNEALKTSSQYLVFLGHTIDLNQATLSTNSTMVQTHQKEQNDRLLCSQQFAAHSSIQGHVSEFVARRRREGDLIDHWLEHSRFTPLPEGVEFLVHYVKNLQVVSLEGNTDISWSKYVKDWDNPEPKYPIHVLGIKLVRWESYRQWLLQKQE